MYKFESKVSCRIVWGGAAGLLERYEYKDEEADENSMEYAIASCIEEYCNHDKDSIIRFIAKVLTTLDESIDLGENKLLDAADTIVEENSQKSE